jgi:hypothetical protein
LREEFYYPRIESSAPPASNYYAPAPPQVLREGPWRTLDSPRGSVARLQPNTFESYKTMGKQYNKVIKKKRHIAYLKRKKAATKKTAKPSKK